jgi:hypothetical protein
MYGPNASLPPRELHFPSHLSNTAFCGESGCTYEGLFREKRPVLIDLSCGSIAVNLGLVQVRGDFSAGVLCGAVLLARRGLRVLAVSRGGLGFEAVDLGLRLLDVL